MQKLLSFFIALFICFSTIAQVNLDSLWNVWNDDSQADTNRLKAIHKISWHGYLYSHPDSAFYFAQLEYDFAESINYKKQMARALNTQGVSFYIRGDYEIAIDYYKKSLKIYEQQVDKKGIANSLNNIANIYADQGYFIKAMNFYSRCLKIKEELGDNKGIALALNNIGVIYADQGIYDKAIIYYNKSLKLRKELGDKKGIASCSNNLGGIYLNQQDYLKALDYYIKGINKYQEIGDNYGIASSLHNIGVVYQNKGNYAKAMDNYSRSLKIREEIGDKRGMAMSLEVIGWIEYNQGKLTKALDKCIKALRMAQEIGNVNSIKSASNNLWKIYKKQGNYKKAFEMYELHIQIRDSIQSDENQRAAIHQDYKYDYEKQAAADSVVAAEANKVKNAQLATLKAENKQHQLEADQQQLLANQQDQQKYFLYGLLALALLFGGFIFNRFRITNKQKQLIESQKDQVEEKNKEILDSIQYAKRLQQAILPPKNIIKEYLPQSFILYKPKDIVAGDFYWMESLNGWIYFAAADCTGHGVPGAMVSVVCSNALSKSVIEEKIVEPAAILNRARELVVERFDRSENEIKDGMDISLCGYHSASGEAKWAGAHNPLWIIRAGSREIEVIKADPQPIASYYLNKPFTAHSLQLNKGDSMYLFTDGFSDQFGGEKSKKYKAANFKRFLLSIQDKDMDTQRELIGKEFDQWKGDLEQIDDVCVMGVRV